MLLVALWDYDVTDITLVMSDVILLVRSRSEVVYVIGVHRQSPYRYCL